MRDMRALQSIVDGIASRTKDLSPNFPSLNAYNRQLREATRQLAIAGQYSIDEGKAIAAVVAATKNQEAAQRRVNNLLREAGLYQDEIRSKEAAASAAARQRLQQQNSARRSAVADVVRTPVANYNPSNVQLGPAGNAEAVRLAAGNAMRRGSDAQIAYEGEIARIKRDFDIKNHNLQIDLLQKELAAELDNIDAVLAARKKANADAEADFDKRLAARGEAKAAAAEKRKAFGRQAESLALGVGFPLLFGGGAGSVLGAAAGSFVGNGFGGQILGGAVGQIIDDFIKSTQDLGIALNEPTKAFDALKERSLLATKALEKLGDRLQDAGFVASASALAQRELASAVGRDGAQNLRELGDAADRSSRAFAEAVARFQGKVAGPLSRIQGFLATGGEISNAQARGFDVNQQLARAGRSNTSEAKALQRLLMPGAGAGKSGDQFLQELRQALAAAEQQLPPLKIKLSPEQVREELKTTLGKQLEALDTGRALVQAVRERARAQEDLDQQRTDMLLQQERAIGDLRRQIEDRITEMRLSNLQRENELLAVQGEIRMQQLRNSNIGLRGRFNDGPASAAANAVADYLESELKAANDAARIKRDAAFEAKRIDIETERFKIQTAIQISRLNQDSAKQIASIQRSVLRQNQDYDGNRFRLEQSLAKLRLQGLAAEFALLAQQGQAAQRQDIAVSASKALTFTQTGIDQIDKLKAPSSLRFNASGLGGVGASTAGVEAQSAQAKLLLGNLTAAQQTLLDLARNGEYEKLKFQLDTNLTKPLTEAANEAQLLFIEFSGQKLGTTSSGFTKAKVDLDDLISKLKNLKNDKSLGGNTGVQALLQSYIDLLPSLSETSNRLVAQKDIITQLNDKQIELTDKLAALKAPYGELTQVQQVRNELLLKGISLEDEYSKQLLSQAAAIDALQEQIKLAGHLQDVYRGVGQAMATAMTSGVNQMVAGTQTAEQVFGSFLNSISEMLLAKSAEMIATYIAIGIARIFAGMGGGGLEGATNAASKLNPTVGFGAGSVPRFAEGGIVTRPTLSMVGEGGQPEYIIPASKMRGAMERYASGARGAAVIPGSSDLGSGDSAAPASAAGAIDVRYTVERINSVDYVTADQFQRGMQQAAQQGAAQGERRAIKTLQASRSTRSRIGLR